MSLDPIEIITLDQWLCLVPSRSESDLGATPGHRVFMHMVAVELGFPTIPDSPNHGLSEIG